MKDVIAEAQKEGVDADVIQACAGEKNWDRLGVFISVARRQRREAMEVEARKEAAAAPMEVSQAQKELAGAKVKVAELEATVKDYETTARELTSQLDASQRSLEQVITQAEPDPE